MMGILPEVETTGGHWSFSMHLIRMTDRFYTWLVGVTNRSIGVRLGYCLCSCSIDLP